MSKNEKMFQQSSYELLATEEDYINDLKTMDQVFNISFLLLYYLGREITISFHYY